MSIIASGGNEPKAKDGSVLISKEAREKASDSELNNSVGIADKFSIASDKGDHVGIYISGTEIRAAIEVAAQDTTFNTPPTEDKIYSGLILGRAFGESRISHQHLQELVISEDDESVAGVVVAINEEENYCLIASVDLAV